MKHTSHNIVVDPRIERLDKIHNRELFDCGEENLNTYIRKQAGQDVKKHISTVYVALMNDEPFHIVGFYTLSTTHIELLDLPVEIAKTLPRYPYVPAYRIGRLAVHKENQKQGIGETLLLDALSRCLKNDISGFAVVVDAKNERVASFYLKYGFIRFPEQPLKFFIPMKVVQNLDL